MKYKLFENPDTLNLSSERKLRYNDKLKCISFAFSPDLEEIWIGPHGEGHSSNCELIIVNGGDYSYSDIIKGRLWVTDFKGNDIKVISFWDLEKYDYTIIKDIFKQLSTELEIDFSDWRLDLSRGSSDIGFTDVIDYEGVNLIELTEEEKEEIEKERLFHLMTPEEKERLRRQGTFTIPDGVGSKKNITKLPKAEYNNMKTKYKFTEKVITKFNDYESYNESLYPNKTIDEFVSRETLYKEFDKYGWSCDPKINKINDIQYDLESNLEISIIFTNNSHDGRYDDETSKNLEEIRKDIKAEDFRITPLPDSINVVFYFDEDEHSDLLKESDTSSANYYKIFNMEDSDQDMQTRLIKDIEKLSKDKLDLIINIIKNQKDVDKKDGKKSRAKYNNLKTLSRKSIGDLTTINTKWEKLNESDTSSGGGAYPGPGISNSISGNMVGSGSDGRLGIKQTEIEGGQDQPTSGGEFPMKYKKTVTKVASKESKNRIAALKKMQKINMMSFDDFNKDKANESNSMNATDIFLDEMGLSLEEIITNYESVNDYELEGYDEEGVIGIVDLYEIDDYLVHVVNWLAHSEKGETTEILKIQPNN